MIYYVLPLSRPILSRRPLYTTHTRTHTHNRVHFLGTLYNFTVVQKIYVLIGDRYTTLRYTRARECVSVFLALAQLTLGLDRRTSPRQ